MQPSSSQPAPQILLTSAGRSWNRLEADLLHIPRGKTHVPGGTMHRLGIHFGPPVNASCFCDGKRMRRVQRPGDINIVPAGLDGSWEDDDDCQILRLRIHQSLIEQVAGELGRGTSETQLRPKFHVRDTRIEAIGWAIKAALEASAPSDSFYIDLLAQALVARLIETACSSSPQHAILGKPTLSARQMRILNEFIRSHLDQKLLLVDLAKVVAMSVTRLKTLFHNNTGVSVHQYVIRCRVEYARALLASTAMPASEVAVAAGFSSQSHMSYTMRRLIGQTPGEIARHPSDFCPILQKTT